MASEDTIECCLEEMLSWLAVKRLDLVPMPAFIRSLLGGKNGDTTLEKNEDSDTV